MATHVAQLDKELKLKLSLCLTKYHCH